MYNKHLDTFIIVADLGSFSKASEKLFVSPNAVMKQINLLEDHLGIKLFARSRHGLSLTEAGALIYKEAKHIIRHSEKALAEARRLAKPNDSLIRIGSSIMCPSHIIMSLWKKVQAVHPELNVQIKSFDDSSEKYLDIIAHLGENIDIISGLFPSTLYNRRCAALELYRFPLCCAMSFRHHLAGKEKLVIEDLYGEKLIMITRGDTSYIDALRDEIEQSHPQIEIIDVPFYDVSTFNLCEELDAIMITAENWNNVHPSLVTIPVDWEYYVPYGLIYSSAPSESVQTFIDTVTKLKEETTE